MPEMTLSEAAKWAGVTRPTIHKALKSGRLSGRRDDIGQWQIDPAELERVYSATKQQHVTDDEPLYTADINQLITGKDRELTLLREMLDEARRERDDVRQDRDHWREQAQTQTRLLTHQQKPRSRWSLFGRKAGD